MKEEGCKKRGARRGVQKEKRDRATSRTPRTHRGARRVLSWACCVGLASGESRAWRIIRNQRPTGDGAHRAATLQCMRMSRVLPWTIKPRKGVSCHRALVASAQFVRRYSIRGSVVWAGSKKQADAEGRWGRSLPPHERRPGRDSLAAHWEPRLAAAGCGGGRGG